MVREHKERRERLEEAASEARAGLSERRAVLDDVQTITAYAQEMSEFLATSELTESKAFIRSFVKEIAVAPAAATIRYTIPMPEDSPLRGDDAEEVALGSPVLFTVKSGGPDLERTRPPSGHEPAHPQALASGTRPNALHLLALLQFAASLNLLHLLALPNVQCSPRAAC